MPPAARDPLDRLVEKFDIDDSGCWVWNASRNDAGYGQMSMPGRRPERAHRLVWMRTVGPIPDALVLDHLCRNRACCNPDHLEPVTLAENIRRGIGAQAARERGAAKTHCKRGHEFTPENTRIGKLRNGFARTCRTCRREQARSRRSL